MRRSLSSARWLMILAAAGAPVLATACSQLIGADFDVVRGSTGTGAGGGGGGATGTGGDDAGPPDGSDGGTTSSSSGGSTSSASSSSSSSGAGGGPICPGALCIPETVADNQDYPWGLVLQGSTVYWATAGASINPGPPTKDGSIWRADLAGGAAVKVLDQLRSPNQLATDGAYLYWTSTAGGGQGAVHRCLITDCVAELVASGQSSPTGIAVLGPYVYWANAGDGTVRRRLRDQLVDGGDAVDTVAITLDYPNLLVADVDALYVTEFSPTGKVWKVEQDLTASPFSMAHDTPAGLAMHGTDVCYTMFIQAGTVLCADKSSKEESNTASSPQPNPAGLASDGKALYWANSNQGGQIMRWRNDDADAVAIASNQHFPNGIIVAGKWVYWTNHELGGSVMRVLKD
jgi:hypothetical protein